MDISAACSISLGSERAIRVTKSGLFQSSARLRSLKVGRVSDASAGEAGPPYYDIGDESALGHSDFHCPGCRQVGHGLTRSGQ